MITRWLIIVLVLAILSGLGAYFYVQWQLNRLEQHVRFVPPSGVQEGK